VGLRSLAFWNCSFESHRDHRFLSVAITVCCQKEVSRISRSLDQESSTEHDVSECVRKISGDLCPLQQSRHEKEYIFLIRRYTHTIILIKNIVKENKSKLNVKDAEMFRRNLSYIISYVRYVIKTLHTSQSTNCTLYLSSNI